MFRDIIEVLESTTTLLDGQLTWGLLSKAERDTIAAQYNALAELLKKLTAGLDIVCKRRMCSTCKT